MVHATVLATVVGLTIDVNGLTIGMLLGSEFELEFMIRMESALCKVALVRFDQIVDGRLTDSNRNA